MHRSRSQLDGYHTRSLSLHKPGVVPNSSRNLSPISSHRHKYELKQKIWPRQTVESWFANHTTDDRRAVYSFLDTVYNEDDRLEKDERHRKSPNLRSNSSVRNPSSHPLQRRMSNQSRASKRDLGEILESLESLRPPASVQERGMQTTATPLVVPLPDVHKVEKRPKTSRDKYTETIPVNHRIETPSNSPNEDETSKVPRRYLSPSWRVINPREDAETNIRPENNRSSFFNFTKKIYPEYFFIHPDWY